MPRIPFSLASGEVPGRIPLMSSPNPGVWGLPGKAVQSAADIVESGSEKLQDAERRVQATQDHLYKSQVLSGLELFMDDDREKYGTQFSGEEAGKQSRQKAQDFLDNALKGARDDRVRNIIRAEAEEKIARGSIITRAHVDKSVITETVRQAEEQVNALYRKGTEAGLTEALDLIAGLSVGGVLTPAQSAQWRDKAIQESVTNHFGREVQLDPEAAYLAANRGLGIYKYADDAQRQNMAIAARREKDYQADRLFQEEARAHQREVWERDKTERIRKDIASDFLADVVDTAMTDPDAAMQKARALGPGGEQEVFTGAELQEIVMRIPSIYAATTERTDPAVDQKVREDFVGTNAMTAQDIALMPGLSKQDKDRWIGLKRQREMDESRERRERRMEGRQAEAEARQAEALKRQAEGDDLRTVERAINDLQRMAGATGDPALASRAAQAAYAASQLAWTNSTLKGGKGAMAWWQTYRPLMEAQIGRDLDMHEETINNMLPPNVREIEDLQALKAVKGWSDTDPTYQRYIGLLRRKDTARQNKKLLGVQKEVQEAVKAGRKAIREGQIPGENTPMTMVEEWNRAGGF